MTMQTYIDFSHTLAQSSGKIIRDLFLSPTLQIEGKRDGTIVTKADKMAEQCMRDLITKHFPKHGILGEEFGNYNEDAEYVWVLDPIDGTISFAHGMAQFGTIIALLHHNQPVLGVFHQPVLNLFCHGDNEQTFLNNSPIHVSKVEKLSEALILTTDVQRMEKTPLKQGFANLQSQARLCRTWGDCYSYFLVASGHAEAAMDPFMMPWDLLPLIPIIKGAGGTITNMEGGNAVHAQSSIATNGKIHKEVLDILHHRG